MTPPGKHFGGDHSPDLSISSISSITPCSLLLPQILGTSAISSSSSATWSRSAKPQPKRAATPRTDRSAPAQGLHFDSFSGTRAGAAGRNRAGRAQAMDAVEPRLGFGGASPAVLAYHGLRWHYDVMGIQITIRDVPERVRDELAARAASQGRSMQEFLRTALERLATRPTADAWLQQVRRRKRVTPTRIDSQQILKNRDADRR
jgi:antitoxin FitA